MPAFIRFITVMLCAILCSSTSLAQDSSAYSKLYSLPDKLFSTIHAESKKAAGKLDRQTTRYLSKLQRQELRLYKQIARKDSTKAKEIFGDINSRYKSLQSSVNGQGRIWHTGGFLLLKWMWEDQAIQVTGGIGTNRHPSSKAMPLSFGQGPLHYGWLRQLLWNVWWKERRRQGEIMQRWIDIIRIIIR